MDRSNILFSYRSSQRRRLRRLIWAQNAPPAFLYPVYWPMQRSCSTTRRCNCCFLATATLPQHSWTLQLLLPGHSNASAALTRGCCNAPAALPDPATAASWPLQRSSWTPGRCNCCYWPLQRSCNTPRRCNCCYLANAKL